MPTIAYKPKNFGAAALQMIFKCNEIITDYASQGYDLTLRQVYYQLVASDLFPEDRKWKWTGSRWIRDEHGTKNAEPNYKWLGLLINDGRLAGLVDWDAIVDRTRALKDLSHWDTPADIIAACSESFNVNLWEGQGKRVEVWIEKDALIGVIEGVCNSLDLPHFSCRGYTSQSEMWGAAQRIIKRFEHDEQETVILHLGDHDPSGIDMTRDIQDRLDLFCNHEDVPVPEVLRIALNMPQVKQYNPPENPAKLTDSRANAYVRRHGDSSWELDALKPPVIGALIRENAMQYCDVFEFRKRQKLQQEHRKTLTKASDNWVKIEKMLSKSRTK